MYFGSSMNILQHDILQHELSGADLDLVLRIRTRRIGLLDATKMEELYELGYRLAKENIQKAKRVLNQTSP